MFQNMNMISKKKKKKKRIENMKMILLFQSEALINGSQNLLNCNIKHMNLVAKRYYCDVFFCFCCSLAIRFEVCLCISLLFPNSRGPFLDLVKNQCQRMECNCFVQKIIFFEGYFLLLFPLSIGNTYDGFYGLYKWDDIWYVSGLVS